MSENFKFVCSRKSILVRRPKVRSCIHKIPSVMSHVNTAHTLTIHFSEKAGNEHFAALTLRPVLMYCNYACLSNFHFNIIF
jgi:hypothetical protein